MIESGTYYEDERVILKVKFGNINSLKKRIKLIKILPKDLVKEINELAKFNKIILIYPFPEFAVNIVKKEN